MVADYKFIAGQLIRFFVIFHMFLHFLLKQAVKGLPVPVHFGLQLLYLCFNGFLQ